MGIIGNIGKVAKDICILEGTVMRDEVMIDGSGSGEKGKGGCVARRGISTLISFSASILVETLYQQSKSQEGSVKSGGAITSGVT